MALPVLAATLTTVVVFFPVTFLYGADQSDGRIVERVLRFDETLIGALPQAHVLEIRPVLQGMPDQIVHAVRQEWRHGLIGQNEPVLRG